MGSATTTKSTAPSPTNPRGQRRHAVAAGEAKVRELNSAVAVDENVGGLQISVDDAFAVEIVDAPHELVANVLPLRVLQNVGFDDCVHVRLLQLESHVQIDVVEAADNVQQFNDIHVVEAEEQHRLAIGPLRVGVVGKGIKNLFERDEFARAAINGLPHDAIGAAANVPNDFVPPLDVRIHLQIHRHSSHPHVLYSSKDFLRGVCLRMLRSLTVIAHAGSFCFGKNALLSDVFCERALHKTLVLHLLKYLAVSLVAMG